MNRRTFLKVGSAGVAAALGGRLASASPAGLPEATAGKLPRWRGFNLLEKFAAPESGPYAESDFEWLSSWGFDFVRLPMDYRCWAKTPEAEFDEAAMQDIDQAVAWGKKYGANEWGSHNADYDISLDATVPAGTREIEVGVGKAAGFGWALWNFRGDFGVLDSGRKDVAYEDFKGHKLDRQMLELLRAS